mgnify:CR=1 FL=1
MNTKALIIAALLCAGTVSVAGCASSPDHNRSAGEVVDDAGITTKVETFNGTVQMSGFVDSQWQIDKAVQVASAVDGVKHVKNDMVHKPE